MYRNERSACPTISPEARVLLTRMEQGAASRPSWPQGRGADIWREAVAYYAALLADLQKIAGISAREEKVAGRSLHIAEPEGAAPVLTSMAGVWLR